MSTPGNIDASLTMGATTTGADSTVEMNDRGTSMHPSTGPEVQEGELTADSTTAVEVQEHSTTESNTAAVAQEVPTIPSTEPTINPKKRKAAEALSDAESLDNSFAPFSDTHCDSDSDSDSDERQSGRGSAHQEGESQSQSDEEEIAHLETQVARVTAERDALRAENVTYHTIIQAQNASSQNQAIINAVTLNPGITKLNEQIADLRANEEIICAVNSREIEVLRINMEERFQALRNESARELQELRSQVERLEGRVNGLLYERQFGRGGQGH